MSVFHREGSPFYWYEFQFKGQPYRGSTKETDKREAEKFERAERQNVINGKRNVAGHSVADIFARYYNAHGKKLKWEPTLSKHMDGLEEFFGPHRRFAEITTKDVAEALDSYAAQSERKNRMNTRTGRQTTRPGSPTNSTVNRRLAVFRQIYLKVRDEWELPIGHVNFKKLTRKEPRERVRHISAAQSRVLLRELEHEAKLVIAWSLATGCRKNETETLEWPRVNYETLQAEVLTKGGGTRFVDLGPDAIAILSMCNRNRRYVFDCTNLRKRFARALKAAGIADFRFHDLRHTFATWLGNACGDIVVVQHALGHGQLSTTERYRHVMRGEVKAGVAKLPMLIEGDVLPLKKQKGDDDGA